MENRKYPKQELSLVSMPIRGHGHGRFLCYTMEEQCVVVHLLHHNGLLLQLTVSLEENRQLATSKSGAYSRIRSASSTMLSLLPAMNRL